MDSLRVEVRHESAFEVYESAEDVGAFFVDGPGDAVGVASVETGMRAEEAESDPAFVDGGGRGSFEAADVDTPVGEATEAKRETAAERFGHGFEGGFAVSAVGLG